MEELIEQFLKDLLKTQGAAKNTVDGYRSDLRRFNEFLKTHPRRIVNQKFIRDFVSHLRGRGYANSTINRRIAALTSFFNYLTAKGKVRVNPCEGVVHTKKVKFQPRVLTQKEIALFLATLQKSFTQVARRDFVMVELLCATGIRATELVSLDTGRLNLDQRIPYIEVRKNGRQRDIAIAPRIVQILRQYVVEIRPRLVKNTEEKALFVDRRGERLTRQGFWLKLKEYAKTTELEGRVTPKTLRHSFAINQLSQGISPHKLQQLLGHAHISTTQKYQRVLG